MSSKIRGNIGAVSTIFSVVLMILDKILELQI